MNTIRILQTLIISSLLLFCAAASAWDDGGEIKVMTQNQYLGADLGPLLTATGSLEFNDALISVLEKIAASRFHDRAQRQAALIAKERPHVVALQEAWRFGCQDLVQPTPPGEGCKNPMIAGAFVDQLEATLSALKMQGVKYKAVASVKNLDTSTIEVPPFPLKGIPFNINGFLAFLTAIDRDVILVRHDVWTRPVDFTKVCPDRISLNGCNYQWVLPAPTPIGTLPIQRGFVAADARVGGKNYRIVTTHLELRELQPGQPIPTFQAVQAAQAAELIETLEATTPWGKSLLVLGDMNSSPEDNEVINGIVPPYEQFVKAGYTDGWTLDWHLQPGYTCCQEENLLNKKSKLSERIDLIFSRQEPAWVDDIRVVGNKQSDKTLPPRPRLWPSDHGAVAGEFHFWH